MKRGCSAVSFFLCRFHSSYLPVTEFYWGSLKGRYNGGNLFWEHRDTETQSLYKNVRETTGLGKGMVLCFCVSVFQRK